MEGRNDAGTTCIVCGATSAMELEESGLMLDGKDSKILQRYICPKCGQPFWKTKEDNNGQRNDR